MTNWALCQDCEFDSHWKISHHNLPYSLKKKFIETDAEKALPKFNTLLSQKLSAEEENFLNFIRSTYWKPMVIIIMVNEWLLSRPIRNKAKRPLSSLLFNFLLEAKGSAMKQEKEKGIQGEKREVKLYL